MSAPTRAAETGRRRAALVLYGAALAQGLTVVAYPASGTFLREVRGLSDADYGSLFLPQTAFTLVGALAAGRWAARLGLRPLLLASSVASLASMGALLASLVVPDGSAMQVLLAGTGLMGLGFGLAAAPLNALPARLFPGAPDAALVALHTAIGAGFALGPALLGAAVAASRWWVVPAGVALAWTALFAAARSSAWPDAPGAGRAGGAAQARSTPDAGGHGALLAFAAVAVAYALAEGTFSNWAGIYLREHLGASEPVAALSISGFWAALTVGRLLVAAIVPRVGKERVWLALPAAMAAVFLLLPTAAGPAAGVALFVAAGLATSAFFPLTVAIASSRFPGREASVSSLLTGALMVGVGAGTFLLGALRAHADLPTLYRVSALYPLAAAVIAVGLVLRPARRRLEEEPSHVEL